MENLNFSFPCFSYNDKYETNMEVDVDEKNNSTVFNINLLKIIENFGENTSSLNTNTNNCNNTYHIQNNYNSNNINFSPNKKKNTFDISYSIEQIFCENSNINIEEEEFQNHEDTCIIYSYITI
jgi:hypothetical protein